MKALNKNLVPECLAFAALAAGLNLYVAPGCIVEWNPGPLWIMVLVVAMRHGSPSGLIGGCAAAALHLWELTRIGYSFQDLIHRSPERLIVPVLYILVGMYLGEKRERLARRSDYYKEGVDDLNRRLDANEIKRLNLERTHVEMEKRIAGHADTILGAYHGLNRLENCDTEPELWATLVDMVRDGMRAEAGGVWSMSPKSLLAVSGAMAEEAPPLASLAARRRGMATVADWAASGRSGSPGAELAGMVDDNPDNPAVLAVSGLEFGRLNRNSTAFFQLAVRRARAALRELRQLDGLRRVSVADPRLGLGSENYLRNRIREQALLSRRHGIPACLLCCRLENAPPADLEDRLAIVLACAIRSSVRASDGIAYFAERRAFVVMLPQCELPGAEVVMHNVLANIGALGVAGGSGDGLLRVAWNVALLGDDMDGPAMYARLFRGMDVAVATVVGAEAVSRVEAKAGAGLKGERGDSSEATE